MNKTTASIFLIIQILCLNATVALAETPHATPMLGVSSAWTGGGLMESHPLKSRSSQLSSTGLKLKESAQTSRQNSGEFKLPNQESLESILNNWQTSLKHLVAGVPSRLTAFSNWASGKIGFSKKGTVADLKMASAPAVIRVHLQPVTSNHSRWLTSEGRLKTVTAH